MKIAFFLPDADQGGGAQVIINLISGMVDRGDAVSVISLNADVQKLLPREVKFYVVAGRSGIPIPAHGSVAMARAVFRMSAILKKIRPHAFLVIWGSSAAMAAWKMSRCDGVFVLGAHASLRAIWSSQSGARRRIHRIAAWVTFRMADLVLAPSAGLAATIADDLGLAKDRIGNIPNPISLRRGDDGVDGVRPYFSAAAKGPLFLGAGRLSAEKDFATLVRAFGEVRRRRQASLVIVGEGPLRLGLEKLIGELGLEDEVTLPGYQSNIGEWMRAADCFVLSSVHEGFGNVVAEALTMGTQVVATDCPHGPAEILDGGKYGFLAPVGNVSALAERMELALTAPIPRTVLLERAAEFSVDRITARYADAIEKARRGATGSREWHGSAS